MEETPRVITPPKGCELLRENVFDDTVDKSDDDELLKRREPTMLRRGNKLVAPSAHSGKKFTVVFDLDETVVYARDGPLYARAYLKDLLRSIRDDFEVIVWTAGERDYAKTVLEEINEDHIIEHLVYRHHKWFNAEDYTKDLTQLGRNMDYTIIIENTPDCVRVNPQNGIIVEDFEVLPDSSDDDVAGTTTSVHNTQAAAEKASTATCSASTAASADHSPQGGGEDAEASPSQSSKAKRKHTDRTLYLLREVLLSLAKSGETVPNFLATCPLLTKQTVLGSDGNEIPIYHLGTRRRRRDAGVAKKVVKENRDKAPRDTPPPEQPSEADTTAVPVKRARSRTGERVAHADTPAARKPKAEEMEGDGQ